MISWDNITELYYGIILRDHLYEKDPGDAWNVPGAPWDPRDPLGTPLGPPGTPLGPPGTPLGPPGTPLGRPGTPLGPPGTSLRRPRDAPGTPGDLQGPLMDPLWTPYGSQKRSYLDKYTAPEALDCCVRTCLSGPIA